MFEIQYLANQENSLIDLRVGEAMHSCIGAWTEAQIVYVQQSRLAERLRDLEEKSPLVLYDIGLGIGTNAVAALHVFLQGSARNLHLVSFEKDLTSIEYALGSIHSFAYLQPFQMWIQELLSTRYLEKTISWPESPPKKLIWELREGDFRSHLFSPSQKAHSDFSPELIYFDLYSPKVCHELWTSEVFSMLFSSSSARRKEGLPSWLLTYSAASSVKKAIENSGFFLLPGVATSKKRATTFATTLSTSSLIQKKSSGVV